MSRKLLIRLVLVAAALVVFAWLFKRSLVSERTTPYTVRSAHLTTWTLTLERAPSETGPLLALAPVPELASHLFRQIFARAMESLNAPATPSVAIVLRQEYQRTLAARMTPEGVLDAARLAGLDQVRPVPRCIVHRRLAVPGGIRQVFFLALDAPAVEAFRGQLGLDAAALSPVMAVAGSGADFESWLPVRVTPEADCAAPVDVVD